MNDPRAQDEARYQELIAREAAHWGRGSEPDSPQIWDDPRLDALILAPPRRRLVERAASSGGPVLELGCGDGDLSLEIAGLGPEVEGVDLSPERVEGARAWAERRGLVGRATFRVGDLNRIELPAGHYDCVVAHHALHHILDLDHLMDAVYAALRPGGRLLVIDFIGAGVFEKLVVAGLYAVLPSAESYGAKWRRHLHRLPAYLASEKRKRAALESGGNALHQESPFEGISQGSIVHVVAERFRVVERFTFCPFWYLLLPRLRMPRTLRHAIVSGWEPVDRALRRSGLTRGAYCYLDAVRD